jgi:uncharacterized repeat protein (TIGR01451 family)
MIMAFSSSAYAAANIVLDKRIGWNVFGLKHNNVNDGPNVTTVGWRYCNTDLVDPALNVTAEFVWDSTNPYIDIRTGSLSSITVAQIDPNSCFDFYFNIEVQRDAAAYDASRDYHIAVTADNVSGTVTSPIGEEIYVEHLVAQARNGIDSLTGPTSVVKGQIYDYYMTAHTATAYEQLITVVDFANNIFRIVSVDVNYTTPTGAENDTIYADACGWVHDPSDPDYFTQSGNIDTCKNLGIYENPEGTDDKVGNDISAHLRIEIIGTGTAEVSGLMYDVSGSSFHYNADYGDPLEVLVITAVEPNIPPIANDDSKANPGAPSVSNPTTLTSVDGNDTDLDGAIDPTTVDLDPVTAGIQNTLTTADGDWSVDVSGNVTFTPNAGFVGTSTAITYVINDDDGATSNLANLTVTYAVIAPSIALIKTAPSIALIKTASASGSNENDTITYAFEVRNTGNVDLTNVRVTDPLTGLVLSGSPIASLDKPGNSNRYATKRSRCDR